MKTLICHAAWLDERKRTLGRLLEQVPDATVLSSKRREHAAIWAHRAWEWVAEQKEPVGILNDDVIVCPEFPKVIDAMCEAAPRRALSLHTSVPQAQTIDGRWCRAYWYTGPGVVLYPEHAAALLDFWSGIPWAFNAKPGANEDVIAIHWAWARQEPFWSSIPAVVRHDTATKSTLGYDGHKLRSSCVDWEAMPPEKQGDMTSPDFWRAGVESPPFVENPWCSTQYLNAVRRGLTLKNPCRSCWQQGALVQAGGILLCGVCLTNCVAPVLRNASVVQG